MSLINEALKKAQQLRAAEAEPAHAATEPRVAVAARKAPRSARAVALISLGLGLVLISGALVAYALFLTPAATVVIGPARSHPDSAAGKSPPEMAAGGEKPSAHVESKSSAPPVPAASPENSPAAAPRSAAAAPGPDSAPSPAPSPTQTSLTAAAPPTAEPVRAFVENMRVMGIRAAGEDSRVLLNGRQYRLNEVVERNLGLRLVKVEANCLTFEDQNGARYLKVF